MCRFYDVSGGPLASAPQQVLCKAQDALGDATGCRLEALGGLEYYLLSAKKSLFLVEPQRGYHEALPSSKREEVRTEAFYHPAQMGRSVKYVYAEAGSLVTGGVQAVQQKTEFLPVDVICAVNQMVLAKWAVHEVTHSYGIEAFFSLKIAVG